MRKRTYLAVAGLCVLARAAPPAAAEEGGRCEILVSVVRGASAVRGPVEVRRLFALDDNMEGVVCLPLFERILAGPDAWKPVATATTGEDGRCVVGGLEPAVYEVWAADEGGAWGSTTLVLPVAGARMDARVEVPANAVMLRARLVTTDGKPFRGRAAILTQAARASMESLAPRGREAALGEDGRIAVGGLAPGAYSVLAVVPGSSAVFSAPIVVPGAEETTFVVDRDAEALHVLAFDDHAHVAVRGAVVVANGIRGDGGWTVARGVTDEAGRCDVRGIGQERGLVYAYAKGYAECGVRDAKGGEGNEARIAMLRAARVEGRVTRATDATAAVGLCVHGPMADGRGNWPAGHAVADADGRYAIDDLGAGDFRFFAVGGGWRTVGVEALRPTERDALVRTLVPGETTRADLTVVPAAHLDGRVLDAQGKPIRGAVATAESIGFDPLGWKSFGLPAGVLAVAATGEDGTYRLDGLVEGRKVRVRIVAPGQPPQSPREVRVGGTEAPPEEVRLDPGRTVDVLVLDDRSGTPVAGARVDAWTESRHGPSDDAEGTTGPDGRARVGPIPTEEGRETYLRVEAPGFADGFQALPKDARDATVRLKASMPLSGVVLFPDGTPAGGASVSIDNGGPTTTADAQGKFHFDEVDPEALPIRAHWASPERGSADVETQVLGGSRDVVLRLSPYDPARWEGRAPRLTVRVLDPDGKPVPSAWVWLRNLDRTDSESEAVKDGVATFHRVPQGSGSEVDLQIDGAKDAEGNWLPVAPVKMRVALGGEVVVRFSAGTTLSGRVLDEQGRGVPGVGLKAVFDDDLPGEYCTHPIRPQATTDAAGAFAIENLPEGRLALIVLVPMEFASVPAATVEGGASDVVVRLRRAVSARVTVLSPQGKPVAGAGAHVYGSSRRTPPRVGPRQETDESGVLTMGGLDPDETYVLEVWPGDEASGALATRVDGWKPKDVTVRLEGALAVSGKVVDPSGAPLPGVAVWARGKSESNEETHGRRAVHTGPDGRFSFGELPSGPVTVTARLEEADDDRTERVVSAGDADVTVVVDPGLTVSIRVTKPATAVGSSSAVLLGDERAGKRRVLRAYVPANDGRVTMRGLVAGARYRLVVTPVAGWSAAREGVAAGEDVEVALTRGRTITGRVRAAEGLLYPSVAVGLAEPFLPLFEGTVAADGAFVVEGVPEGPWHLLAYAWRSLTGEEGARVLVSRPLSSDETYDLEIR